MNNKRTLEECCEVANEKLDEVRRLQELIDKDPENTDLLLSIKTACQEARKALDRMDEAVAWVRADMALAKMMEKQ